MQTAAQDAADALGTEVTALAEVRLNGLRQKQRVTVVAVPDTH
ncbi:hypothetical protein [Deinococcus sp. YIM 77859]|nr:hypothetical protein [Deinococcus sp. YIM 77859]